MASPKPTELLREAIDAARAALRDMEPDEVPARVRRIQASSERNLPVPLAMSLLRELGSDEHLRAKALEAWDGEPPGSGPGAASHAFLERRPGWEAVVVAEALAAGERRGAATDQSLQLERDALAAEVAAGKEQARRQREEFSRRERELRDALEAERAPVRSDRQAEQRLAERLDQERAGWAEREDELLRRAEELEREVRRLQEVARAERQARSDMSAALEAGAVGGLPTDPIALARHLDELAAHSASLVPTPESDSGSASPPEAVALDPTVRPDQAEAVDWLVATAPRAVFVDGYNLGFKLARLEPLRARALALEVVGRLAVALGTTEVTVVFDSSVDEEDHSRGSRTGNLSVQFTNGETADDSIVAQVCDGSPSVVVVTSDRALRNRVEACGAVALWSEALLEWSRRR